MTGTPSCFQRSFAALVADLLMAGERIVAPPAMATPAHR